MIDIDFTSGFSSPEKSVALYADWLKKSTNLSESSIAKYSGAVRTISREMHETGVIPKPIQFMNIFELDIAIYTILNNDYFNNKNSRGNNMYSNALKHYRHFVSSIFGDQGVSQGVDEIFYNTTIPETERIAVIQARIGQGFFREQLVKKYNGKCIITGISHPKLLVASHIKPWAVSTNAERISVDNGLLLSATYDRLFDSGLITFDKMGRLYLSSLIGDDNVKKLGLKKDMKFELSLNHNMIDFLEYHSDVLFVK